MPLKVKKVTGPTIAASVQFNGSTQYLSGTGTLVSGATNFTAEAWIYLTSTPSTNAAGIIGTSNAAASPLGWLLRITGATYAPANRVSFQETWSANELFSDTILSNNTWYHIAAVRSGSVSSIFINGIKQATTGTFNQSYTSTNFVVGRDWPNVSLEYFPGYISNVRVVSGTALYTSNFTPPAATLTAISGTSLLTCHDTSIYDASTNNFTITNNNTATVSTVSPFPVLRSAQFNGSSQYLRIADNAAFNFGLSSFTVEMWYLPPPTLSSQNTSYPRLIQKGTYATTGFWALLYVALGNAGSLSFSCGNPPIGVGGGSVTGSVWTHIAVTNDGTLLRLFKDGQLVGTGSMSGSLSNASPVDIAFDAAYTYPSGLTSGSISNLRVLKGTALYTASFSAPINPLTAITSCSLLTCNDQTIRDASINNFTITNTGTVPVSTVTPLTVYLPSSMKFKKSNVSAGVNSVSFNGTSQYLTIANSSAVQLNTGNFTIEGWIYVTAFPGSSAGNDLATVCDKDGIQGSTYSSYSIRCTNSGGVIKLKADCNTSSGGGTTGAVTSTTTINTGTWYHFAYVRNGANAYLYINGTQEASAGIIDFYTTTNPVYIGYGNNSVSRFYWPGYISNFRIVKGTAVYTSSFTTSTVPLTAISGTSLLACQSATIVDASSNNFTITNNGSATVSSIVPFSIRPGTFKVIKPAAVVYLTQKAIFGYGAGPVSITNLVSNTGVVSTNTTGVGTARQSLAAAGYGTDKAIFGYGYTTVVVSMTNLVSNTGVVSTDTTGVGQPRWMPAAASYGTDKAIFGYGAHPGYSPDSMTNLVSNTGVVATDTTGVGTARYNLAAAGYGTDKAIFGYGIYPSNLSITNLVNNTGVVATNTTGVGTARQGPAAASYGSDKAIFGYGYSTDTVSMTNLVSNTGVVSTDTTGVGTARYQLAAAGYGRDKAIFGYGLNTSGVNVSITNLVSNTGVVATDTTGVGTARASLAAAGYSLT